jgi:hypothetical protein
MLWVLFKCEEMVKVSALWLVCDWPGYNVAAG